MGRRRPGPGRQGRVGRRRRCSQDATATARADSTVISPWLRPRLAAMPPCRHARSGRQHRPPPIPSELPICAQTSKLPASIAGVNQPQITKPRRASPAHRHVAGGRPRSLLAAVRLPLMTYVHSKAGAHAANEKKKKRRRPRESKTKRHTNNNQKVVRYGVVLLYALFRPGFTSLPLRHWQVWAVNSGQSCCSLLVNKSKSPIIAG